MTLNRARTLRASPLPAVSPRCQCGCHRRRRRYPTDQTDIQWAILEPLLPEPACRTKTGGRPEKHHRRAILDAIFYLIDNGIKWRALPADFPPWRTVYGYYARWAANLSTMILTDRLRAKVRRAQHRAVSPTAAIIDSQSVHRTAEATVPRNTSGFDPHKKVNGRKRHILTDTLGLLIAVVVTPANVQDRDAARPLLDEAALTAIRLIWADNGYAGDLATWAHKTHSINLKIVPRQPGVKGFHPLPRRWVVERTLAWISRRRRCARDYERLTDHHETNVHWAAIIHMTRRLTRHHKPHNPDQKQPL
jgi:putative transposase